MSNIKYSREQQPLTVEITGAPGSGKSSVARLIAAALHASGMDVVLASRDDLKNYSAAQDNVENSRVVVTDSLYGGPLFEGGHWCWEHGNGVSIDGSPAEQPIRDRGDFWEKIESAVRGVGLLSKTASDDVITGLIDNSVATISTDLFTQYRHPQLVIERDGSRMNKIEITVYGLFSSEPFERTYILYGPETIVCMMRNARDQEAYQETAYSNDDMARHQEGLTEDSSDDRLPREVFRDECRNVVETVMGKLLGSFAMNENETESDRNLDAFAIRSILARALGARYGHAMPNVRVEVKLGFISVALQPASGIGSLQTFQRLVNAPDGYLQAGARMVKLALPGFIAMSEAAARGEGDRPRARFLNAVTVQELNSLSLMIDEDGPAISLSAHVQVDEDGTEGIVVVTFDPTKHGVDAVVKLAEQFREKTTGGNVVAQGVKVTVIEGPENILLNKLTTSVAAYAAAFAQDTVEFNARQHVGALEACRLDLANRLSVFGFADAVVSLSILDNDLIANVTIGATQAAISASLVNIPNGPAKENAVLLHNTTIAPLKALRASVNSGDISSDAQLLQTLAGTDAQAWTNGRDVVVDHGLVALFFIGRNHLPRAKFFVVAAAGTPGYEFGEKALYVRAAWSGKRLTTGGRETPRDSDLTITHVGDRHPRDEKLTTPYLRKLCRVPRKVAVSITPNLSEWPKVKNFEVRTTTELFKVRLVASRPEVTKATKKVAKKAVAKKSSKK